MVVGLGNWVGADVGGRVLVGSIVFVGTRVFVGSGAFVGIGEVIGVGKFPRQLVRAGASEIPSKIFRSVIVRPLVFFVTG